jgi:serine/threonine-protein kinase RsbW/stage II sporulation protein AB (anti-sigma F factor)
MAPASPSTERAMVADPPRWSHEAAAVPASVSLLRRALVAFAADHGAGAGTQGDIALAASEAITNTVVHAYVGMAPGTVTLEATVADDRLRVTISDDGGGMAPRPDSPGMGLGLPTIAHLAASVTVAPGLGGRGTAVSLEFTLP